MTILHTITYVRVFTILTIVTVATFILAENIRDYWPTHPELQHVRFETRQELLKARWRKYMGRNASKLPTHVIDELKVKLKNASEEKVIIMWYPPFGVFSAYKVDPKECGNCVITHDKSLITEKRTAAVVIHFNEITPNTMPTYRHSDQLHIFFTMEAPPALKLSRRRTLEYEDQYGFNATASYRRDSDFLAPYSMLSEKIRSFFEDSLNSTTRNLMKTKRKTAVTVISNCALTVGAKKRLSLIREIKDHGFNLETFGACFNQPLPRDDNFIERLRPYKFYFAFENSYHCRDYITEKFFANGLSSGALPVVWGPKREDYEMVAPPNSFIHVDDFSSIKELVEYLEYLNENDTAYLEYFRWYEILGKQLEHNERKSFLCHLCRTVHGINVDDAFRPNYDAAKPSRPYFSQQISQRTVSLRKWFYDTEDPDCFKDW